MLNATLTLPGIAGIVLTVGIAVDSNVLIYERIREELRGGRNAISAIDAGFRRALSTILDSNITTFIAAAVLFYIGTGPVRGFAVTLGIGIITTVFTAFTLTSLIVAGWVRWKRPKIRADLGISKLVTNFVLIGLGIVIAVLTVVSALGLLPSLRIVPDNTHFDFTRFRRISFPISALLSIVAITLFFTHGLNFGIDFKGGTLLEVQSKSGSADIGAMRATLSTLGLGDIQLQQFGGPADVLIRVAEQPGGDAAQQVAVQKVRGALGDAVDYRRVEVVGPRVSGELLAYGMLGLMLAIFAILIYLWFRFEWQFALGAMIANVHDIVLTIGFMSISQVDFDLTSIAALLTILGYSLNDTVVIYDRIREMLRRYKKMPMPELLNESINSTLSRSIITHFTVTLALLALLLFGGHAIHSFTAVMMFGVVLVGTYTSIFIAAPILIYLGVGANRDATGNAVRRSSGMIPQNIRSGHGPRVGTGFGQDHAQSTQPTSLGRPASSEVGADRGLRQWRIRLRRRCRIAVRCCACRTAIWAWPVTEAGGDRRIFAGARVRGRQYHRHADRRYRHRCLGAADEACARRCARSASCWTPMQTGPAIRTYNIMLGERRRVAAALIAVP